jgi:hypothetical protein
VTGFHVHVATERYQAAGFKEDSYAEATNSYIDLPGAIDTCLTSPTLSRRPRLAFRCPYEPVT